MAERSAPAYGTPNWEMIGRWLQLEPAHDGPFWALNLMKYRAVASYADGRPGVSGREADDAYAPLGPLAAIGARPAFHGDVVDQPLGEPRWDRVGIVAYPSRAAFFAMQQRDDFRAQHEHKEAGMERTIVLACHPTAHDAGASDRGSLVLIVERGAHDADLDVDGVTGVVAFAVEGVIVGDERTYDRARFVRASDDAAMATLVTRTAAAEEAHVVVVDPAIDQLIETIETIETR